MDILTVIILAVATVASALTFLSRLVPWHQIIKYRAFVDVIFTVIMFLVFAGTLGGALVAAIGGLFLAVVLSISAKAKMITTNQRRHF